MSTAQKNSAVCLCVLEKSSSAIAERSRCSVGRFWPKVEDDTVDLSSTTVT